MNDDMTPRGKLERMKMDIEMEAALHAAYSILRNEADSFEARGEGWRANLFRPAMKSLEQAIEVCPRDNLISQIIDERHLRAFNQWYEEHREEFQ